ncbi:hypothetical protein MLD38_033495 [Melastoma candidum]|uniref:Uncharacterized protein n=1 Tax=Melastoma candidum TaxID=119954 RepID=A0ACB9M6M6_9MYRT|nr:hypothetical protein MLD38_033495 [Melastoma candidum]
MDSDSICATLALVPSATGIPHPKEVELESSDTTCDALFPRNTILAEFARNSDLVALGNRCIDCAPAFHSEFSHTCRNTTYTFLIDRPFVFFGIFDGSLAKTERFGFLGRIKSSFLGLVERGLVVDLENLNRYALQKEFEGIIQGIVNPVGCLASESPGHVRVRDRDNGTDSDKGMRPFMAPLLGTPSKGLKKKKRGNGEHWSVNSGNNHHKEGSFENWAEVCGEASCRITFNNGGSRDSSGGNVLKSVGDRLRVKKAWRRQLWVVLMLDLFFCLVLFAVWLWICRGFQCIMG